MAVDGFDRGIVRRFSGAEVAAGFADPVRFRQPGSAGGRGRGPNPPGSRGITGGDVAGMCQVSVSCVNPSVYIRIARQRAGADGWAVGQPLEIQGRFNPTGKLGLNMQRTHSH